MKQQDQQTRQGSIPIHRLQSTPGGTAPFEISSLEQMAGAARAGYSHRHDFYQVLYLTSGQGRHVVDFTALPIDPPCLYFISPGQVHFWQLSEPLAGKAVLFAQEFLVLSSVGDSLLYDLAFFHSLEGAPSLHLKGRDAETFADLIRRLEHEYVHPAFGRSSVLGAYLHILLVEIQRRYQGTRAGAPRDKAPSVVRRFKKLVSERFVTDRAVTSYGEAMGLSAGHLSETVKAVTRRTAGQLIRDEVTTEAKRLLAHSQFSVAEIAYRLNFEDPSYFGRFFRREAGQSPGAFRCGFREKYQAIR